MAKGRKPKFGKVDVESARVKHAHKAADQAVELADSLTNAMCQVVEVMSPDPQLKAALAANIATNLIGAAICNEQEEHRNALLLEICDSIRRHGKTHGFNVVTTIHKYPEGSRCKKDAVMKIITLDELKKLDLNALIKQMEKSPVNQRR